MNAAVLAAFVTPGLALAGAGAVSIPIIIHLLARRRFKRIRWAAMDFLLDAERRNRRRIRMEEWILLALRCLAVLLLGLILSRPFLSAARSVLAWGGSRPVERIFLLDDSLSMAYQSGDATSLARAKAAVRGLLEFLRRETPDDPVTVVRTTRMSQPLEVGAFLDDAKAEDLVSRIDAVGPSQRSMDLAEVVRSVADLLRRDAGILNAAVYLVSDFQNLDWPGAAGGEMDSDAGLFQPVSAWSKENRNLRLVLINVGDENAANHAVTELKLSGGPFVAGTEAVLQTEVSNFASRPADRMDLRVTVGGKPAAAKSINALGERRTAIVEFEIALAQSGDEFLRVELPVDALPGDDARFAATEVFRAVRILVVNGEPAADDYDDEAALLATALHPEGEVFSGHEVTVIDESGLEGAPLATYHAVVFANVYRISETAVESLDRYIRGGGGVVIFLGDQVDPDSYNASLFRDGKGWLPLELAETVRPAESTHMTITDTLHPALRGLAGPDDPLGIGQIPFLAYFAMREAEGSQGAEANLNSESARNVAVLARFDSADGPPAIVERVFGAGRVLLLNTTADKEWNVWADHPTFVPVINEFLRYAARRADAAESAKVGFPVELPFDVAAYENDAGVRTPAYPNEPEAPVSAVPDNDGQGMVFRWDHTDTAGIYHFALRRRDGGETVRYVAVNFDPRESDLTMAQEEQLRRTVGGIPMDYVRGVEKLLDASDEGRTELWRSFLLAVLLVLMGEQTIAWWWGRGR